MLIRLFERGDEAAVIDLWRAAKLVRPWNSPERDIARKLAVQPDLFFVGEIDNTIVASAMAGYDGHRGWINYLAVDPKRERQGLGRMIMDYVEDQLIARGCPKINVQIRSENTQVLAFYRSMGFSDDAAVSLGKRLIPDN